MSCYIIAEAGVNHNGNIEYAKRLIELAKEAGADAIKFQTFISEQLVAHNAEKAEYQKKATTVNESQLDMLKKLELSFDDFNELYLYCKELNIDFLSSAFDLQSVDFLNQIGIEKWKIPSGEITNLPYLEKIAKLQKPVIISTGMCTLDEIRDAVSVFERNGCKDITLLHCTTEYPAPFNEVNLKAMLAIKMEFGYKVGYSDHTTGITIPIAAVALGAEVIEKHFTLNCMFDGPDHKASIEPNELKLMVESIRNVETSLGDGVKEPTYSERKNIVIARKSIFAKKLIEKGEVFTEDNLTIKRPGNGISPMRWFDVIGKCAIKDFDKDELIVL